MHDTGSPDASSPRPRRRRSIGLVVVGSLLASATVAAPASAHGPAPTEPPTAIGLLSGWTFEPLPTLAIVVALAWWAWAIRRVAAAHPSKPIPRRRSLAFIAGMAALAFGLTSGIDRYDTTLFSVHMVQHVLLTLVAAPLIVLSAPVTLVLRVASPATRRRWLLPLLHARVTRVLSHPVVAWIVFAGVMWVSHFSPLFDAALEDPLIHDAEHVLFLVAALLFWWPAIGLDPTPWRLSHPVRALFIVLQMTQNTLLSVVILNAQVVLYPHYATVQRSWGPSPLEDQQIAAAFMWVAGDLLFLAAAFLQLVGWSRAEGRDSARVDRRAAEELAAIRVRERRLADRLREASTDGAPDAQPGSGASR